ncbi:MAG: hypothetical protein IPP83_13930 [Flavobacteriales bacterium]|nr:hypothetical protein [Flavobacteriales bacterium]
MWAWLSSRILRNRYGILVVIGVITVFLGLQTRNVKVSYKFGGLLPKTDSAYVQYEELLANFSENGNIIVLGVEDPRLYELDNFKRGGNWARTSSSNRVWIRCSPKRTSSHSSAMTA